MKCFIFSVFALLSTALFAQTPPWMDQDIFLDRLSQHISSLVEINSQMQSASIDTPDKMQHFMMMHCKKMQTVKKIEKCLLMNFLEKEAMNDDTYVKQLALVQKMIQKAKYLENHFDKTKSDELNQDFNEFKRLFSPKREYPIRRPCAD
jgi:hypothetical protein